MRHLPLTPVLLLIDSDANMDSLSRLSTPSCGKQVLGGPVMRIRYSCVSDEASSGAADLFY